MIVMHNQWPAFKNLIAMMNSLGIKIDLSTVSISVYTYGYVITRVGSHAYHEISSHRHLRQDKVLEKFKT
jgi:hypothetical protein